MLITSGDRRHSSKHRAAGWRQHIRATTGKSVTQLSLSVSSPTVHAPRLQRTRMVRACTGLSHACHHSGGSGGHAHTPRGVGIAQPQFTVIVEAPTDHAAARRHHTCMLVACRKGHDTSGSWCAGWSHDSGTAAVSQLTVEVVPPADNVTSRLEDARVVIPARYSRCAAHGAHKRGAALIDNPTVAQLAVGAMAPAVNGPSGR